VEISKPKCKYCIVDQKTIKEFENTMWVKVAKCNLMIMDVGMAWSLCQNMKNMTT
jgi:hypothetical protein